MLKQLLASTSIVALLLASGSMVGAKALVASNATSSTSKNSATNNSKKPAHHNSNRSGSPKVCKSIPIPRPSVGGTRERIEAIRQCDAARTKKQQTPTIPTTQPNF